MFFGYNFPKLEPVVEILNISDGPRCAVTPEKLGKWPSGSAVKPQPTNPGCQNVFCNFSFFLVSRQRGLSATYPAPISTIFTARAMLALQALY